MSATVKDTNKAIKVSLHERPGHLVRRLHQNMVAAFTHLTAGYDVSNVQFATLKAIDALEPVTQRRVAAYIAMEPSNMHSVLRRLQARRLISVRANRGDKRRSEIRLTSSGRALLDALEPLELQVGSVLLEPLAADEREVFLRLLHKLVLSSATGTVR